MDEPRTPAIVLDIEGTTTPFEFVHQVLIPYARPRMADVLRVRHPEPEVASVIAEAASLSGIEAGDIEGIVRVLLAWSDADRKIPVLKRLQGLIWRQAFRDGAFRTPVFPDVLPALRRWQAQGIRLYIYSSGAVEAQQMLFRHSSEGDLTGCFAGYFDATLGAKTDEKSYRLIQDSIRQEAGSLLFLSDSVDEIAAARAAGWNAVLVERTGPVPGRVPPVIQSFSELTL